MYKEYSKYKADDFLTDDYFIDSMHHSTPDSELFWKNLILKEEIDVNEFIAAYSFFNDVHKNVKVVSDENLDKLWSRIENTTKRKQHKKLWIKFSKYVAAASVMLLIGSISFFMLNNNQNTSSPIKDYAEENLIHIQNRDTEIVVLSGDKKITVGGTQADLEYDTDGNLKLNTEDVTTKKSKSTNIENPKYNQLKVPFGKRAFLKLSDGSSIWVNTGTTVTYPTSFSSKIREIYVDGEVYAEIVSEPKRPFIIKTEKLDVQVIGTSFNLTAYKADNSTNVVLVNGKVNVSPLNGKPTSMKPNQLYTYTEQSSTLRNVNVENHTSWREGIYIFRNEPIENVLLRLARYYNVTMKLPLEPSGINCSGKLELKDELNQVLSGLSEISSMSYGMKENAYQIRFN